MIKAIFWDNDGILVDTEHLYFTTTKQVLATAGINLTEEMYIEFFLIKGNGTWHLVKDRGFPSEYIDNLRNERNLLYAKILQEKCKVIEGAKDVLENLHGEYLMGVVTSSRKEHFELIHNSTELLKYFDFILTGDDYTSFKPNPDPYLMAVEKSGFKKEECLAIEDSERGLISAKSAGINCFVIPGGLTSNGNFSNADKVLKNIREVPGELKRFKN
jgi:HAD superfamily hydrolase (TIGR01509 family)